MCSICDGATREDVLTETPRRIERFGFTMLGVEPNPDRPPWVYSVGLVERHNHPEVCVLGLPLEQAFDIVGDVANWVLSGERLSPDRALVVGGRRFHVDELDDRVVAGDMLGQWHNYYDWLGRPELRPSAFELVLCGRSMR